MSYNISTWTTKELRDFRVPMKALLECDELDSPVYDDVTGVQTFTGLSEAFELCGMETDDWLHVQHIEYWGIGSGRNFDDLKDIFSQSTGLLIAILVWEGGDSIERLTVQNGTITEEPVAL
jgi:hypothetical protein